MNNRIKWDIRFLQLTKQISKWSKDPNTKVGAVIVRPDKSIISTGFNGFPIGCNDNYDLYNNKENKLKQIIHAELNAILLARINLQDCIMYVYPPGVGPSCNQCVIAIIQSGIKRIVHYIKTDSRCKSSWTEPAILGLNLFKEAGVEVTIYKESKTDKDI